MKLLLDENLPHDLRHFLPGHDVFTVAFMGWRGVHNGKLLAAAAAVQFDAMISIDAGLEYQQNLIDLPIGIVLLKSRSNLLVDLMPLIPALLDALAGMKPRTLVKVG